MSLDIYVREPDCEHCGHKGASTNINITYNLGRMWRAAGFDDAACDEGEAGEIVHMIELAIANLRADPERFRAMNPANGWGTYEGLIDALDLLRAACTAHPNGRLSTWR